MHLLKHTRTSKSKVIALISIPLGLILLFMGFERTMGVMSPQECKRNDPGLDKLAEVGIGSVGNDWIRNTKVLIKSSYIENQSGIAGYYPGFLAWGNTSASQTFAAVKIISSGEFYDVDSIDVSQFMSNEEAIVSSCSGGVPKDDLYSMIALSALDEKISLPLEIIDDCINRKYGKNEESLYDILQALRSYRVIGADGARHLEEFIARGRKYIEESTGVPRNVYAIQVIALLSSMGIEGDWSGILNDVSDLLKNNEPIFINPQISASWLELSDRGLVSCDDNCKALVIQSLNKYVSQYNDRGFCRNGVCNLLDTATAIDTMAKMKRATEFLDVKMAIERMYTPFGWIAQVDAEMDLEETVSAVVVSKIVDYNNHDKQKLARFINAELRHAASCKSLYLSVLGIAHLESSGIDTDLASIPENVSEAAKVAYAKIDKADLDGYCALYAFGTNDVDAVDDSRKLMKSIASRDDIKSADLMSLAVIGALSGEDIPVMRDELNALSVGGGYVNSRGDVKNPPGIWSTLNAGTYGLMVFGASMPNLEELRHASRRFEYDLGGFSALDSHLPGVGVIPTLEDSLAGLALYGVIERASVCGRGWGLYFPQIAKLVGR
jgi:hypothetical protein